MKKIIKLEGLCCANCASKIETEVQKLAGVQQASLSFMTQRLIIEADEQQVEQILEQSKVIANKIEPEADFKVIR